MFVRRYLLRLVSTAILASLAGQTSLVYSQQPEQSSETATINMLPGVVMPTRIVTLATPFDGRLDQIKVVAGDTVERNQVLAVMDDRVALAALELAQANASLQSDILLAESQLKANRRLAERIAGAHRDRAAADVELDRAINEVEVAQLALERAVAARDQQLQQAKLAAARHEEHFVRAPFAGTVTRVIARDGQSLTRASELLTLVDLTQLEVDLQVPLEYFRSLAVGNDYWLVAEAPVHRRLKARLVYTEPGIDLASDSFRCRFILGNENQELPYGFAVRLATLPDSSEITVNSLATRPLAAVSP